MPRAPSFIASLALALLLTQAVRCDEAPDCDLLGAPRMTATATLPEWAVVELTRHSGDVENVRVQADGTFDSALFGGDYGGIGGGTVEIEDGRVWLRFAPYDADGRRLQMELIHTTDGRYFVGQAHYADRGIDQRRCEVSEYQVGNFCGRDVGGCGGYGRVEACSADEIWGTETSTAGLRGPW